MTTEVLTHPTTASAARAVEPTEAPAHPPTRRKAGLLARLRRKREDRTFIFQSVELTTPEVHEFARERPTDYARGAAVLARARQVDEIDAPTGGSPFGA